MITMFFLFLLPLTLLNQELLAEEPEIIFHVVVPDSLVTADTIFIAGNVAQLGNWQPDAIPLVRLNNNEWQLKVHLPLNRTIEYKFTRGSWETEEVLADGTIPENKRFQVTKEQTISWRIQNWKDRCYKPVGGITGTLEYHRHFPAKKLQDRTIIVWLPESYTRELQKRYAVLYMHDGQNLFDPRTSFLGVDWQIDETADSLIRKGEIEEIIIVGIYNTPDRLAEYSDSEKGRAYMDFIVNELKPFIDNKYRTRPDRNHTAVMGSSMGGLISFYLAWRYPEVFGKTACLSATFLWNHGVLLDEIKNFTGQKKEIHIYFDHGGIGEEGRDTPYYQNMKTLLIARGFQLGRDLEYFYDRDGEHSERSWAKRAWRPLKFLFGIVKERNKSDFDDQVKRHNP